MSPVKTTAPRKPCQRCADAGFDPEAAVCFYCHEPIQNRHEHDHFPIPKRHGGENVVPVCIPCHDVKDRIAFKDWDVLEAWTAVADAPPVVRIFLARLMAWHYDLKAKS